MRRQLPKWAMTRMAIVCVALLVNGCEAQVWGAPPAAEHTPQAPVVTPQASLPALPEAPPDQTAAPLDGLDARVRQATADAAKSGANIETVVLDRNTGQIVSNGNNKPFPIASVVKLFIADDLLLQESQGKTTLSAADRTSLDIMLRSSDDSAAQMFWDRSGQNAIIARVKARYGLAGTTAPYNGHWDVTQSTASDLVRYYDMLLNGTRWATTRAGQRHHRATSRNPHRREPTGIRSGSESPTGSMPSRLRSSRAGSAAGTAPTSCTCPPA